MRMVAGFVCGIVLSGIACGGGSGSGDESGFVSCTELESTGGTGILEICAEVSGPGAQALQQSCTQAAAAGSGVTVTFANGPCSHVNALGGCRSTMNGVTEDGWYYKSSTSDAAGYGQTTADIQMLCSLANEMFLPP
jgi:hypothetical protein